MKTEFHAKHVKHYAALIILLVVTAASGFILFNDAYEEKPTTSPKIIEENANNEAENVYNTVDKKELSTVDHQDKNDKSIEQPIQIENEEKTETQKENTVEVHTLPETFSEVSEEEETLINATLKAPGGVSYTARIAENSTVYDLMNTLQNLGIINFTTKDFGGNLGLFVEQIGGIENGSDNKYWIYYINGQEAKTGISNYTLNNNDVIEWKYEESTF